MPDSSNISHMISSIWLVRLYQVLYAFIFFAAGCKCRREKKKRLELDWQLQLVVQCCNPLSLYFLLCSTQRCKRQRGHLHSMENKAHVKFAIFAMEFPLGLDIDWTTGHFEKQFGSKSNMGASKPLLLLVLDVAGRRLPNKTCRLLLLQL